MSKPTIGVLAEGGRDVPIDVDRLVATRLLIQANSGGGKSYAIRRLLEQTHGKVQHLVLDVEGEFYTLREKYDYVLAGRSGGDCPAHPRAAALIARRFLELGVSAIVDLYELKSHERFAFVRAFLDALVDAPRALWHPALVVVDEAHQFCPEHGKAESASSVIDLCTKGRKRGYAAVLATQRLAKLHKDAAAECINKLIGRCGLDVDMRRAGEELGFATRADALRLRSLPPGRFFAFGPAFCDTIELVDVGKVETTHLHAGARAAPVAPARNRVLEVLAQLADVPKEAEEQAKDLDEARARIRRLETELSRGRTAAPAPSTELLERAREEGATKAVAEGRRLWKEVDAWIDRVQAATVTVEKAFENITAAFAARPSAADFVPINGSVPRAGPPAIVERRPPPERRPREARAPRPEGVDGPMQRVLDAMAWLEAAGIVGPYSRPQVAALAGYAPNGGSFGNTLGRLRSAGLIDYPTDGALEFTAEGRSVASSPEVPTTAEEIQRRVLERVDGPMQRCLEPVLASYPKPMSRQDVAAVAGYEVGGGSFSNVLGRLRTLGAIDYPRPGFVVARGWLFLEAAR